MTKAELEAVIKYHQAIKDRANIDSQNDSFEKTIAD